MPITQTLPQLSDSLPAILEIARWAPSVHNVQPWLVSASEDSLVVHIDRRYALQEGDPTGRETTISLGIFCEALCIGARALGFSPSKVKLQDDMATIHLEGSQPDASAQQAVEYLRWRCTDRSAFQPVSLTKDFVNRIQNSNPSSNLGIHVVTDRTIIERVAKLTSQAIGVALSNPLFRKELCNYLVLPWSKQRRGIAVKSLYLPLPVALLQPLMLRLGLITKNEAAAEKRRWLSASGLVLITAKGDLAQYWFEVGRAYLQVSLTIEAEGLSQATSAAIVEASNYHEDIEALLGTKQRILALIRIGKGSPRRYHSPRVSASELIEPTLR